MTNAEKLIRQVNDDWNDDKIDTLIDLIDKVGCNYCIAHSKEPIPVVIGGEENVVYCKHLADKYNRGVKPTYTCVDEIRKYLMKEDTDNGDVQ